VQRAATPKGITGSRSVLAFSRVKVLDMCSTPTGVNWVGHPPTLGESDTSASAQRRRASLGRARSFSVPSLKSGTQCSTPKGIAGSGTRAVVLSSTSSVHENTRLHVSALFVSTPIGITGSSTRRSSRTSRSGRCRAQRRWASLGRPLGLAVGALGQRFVLNAEGITGSGTRP
jgi:hypothetical protein